MQTGTFYGRPRYRDRPKYPHLPTDEKRERAVISDSGGSIGCTKYYEDYAKKGLTGGLMVFWCTHSVCLGFHCIPKGEGRNDVFSAIFTHWKRAPRFIIYDYACALAPYCMIREPEYYEDTSFFIDGFHAFGHTRCSPACFIAAYKAWSETLRKTNSSAGECGNSGLAKIRRPLSYMSQRHAIIFAYVYLAMWNRLRYAGVEQELAEIQEEERARRKAAKVKSDAAKKQHRKKKSTQSVQSAKADRPRKTPSKPAATSSSKKLKYVLAPVPFEGDH